jgi:hypothetical protein
MTSDPINPGKLLNDIRNKKLTKKQRSEIARKAGKAGGRGRPKKKPSTDKLT